MTEKRLETARGVVHYWISQNPGATALFFLHGLGADHRMFDAQCAYFERSCALLAWDEPGSGASRPYSGADMLHCAEALKQILDAEGVERCVLIGHSLGGMLAQTFADHWPERALGFVGIGAAPMCRDYYGQGDFARMERMRSAAKLLPFRSLHALIARRSSHTAHGRRLMARMLEPYSREELCALVRRSLRELQRGMEDAQPIDCPKLLLMGECDRTRKLRTLCLAWRDRERVPLYRIRGAGHLANVDNPRSVNQLIRAFLNRLK